MRTISNRAFFVAALLVCVAFAAAQGGNGGQGGQGGGQGRGQGQGRRGGGFGQFGGGQFGRGGNNELTLALRKDVQTDLAVTDDQKKKLDDLNAKQREARRGQFGGGAGGGQRGNGGGGNGGGGNGGGGFGGGQGIDREALQKRMEEQRTQTHKDLAAILNEGQMKRLGEISVQLRGNRAILDTAVQKELGFTSEQSTKLKDLQDKQQAANQSLFEKVRNNEMSREDVQAAMEKNNKTMDEELGKILTSEQTAKLKAMGGKPFKADPNEAQGRRNGGGGGGGGRGGL